MGYSWRLSIVLGFFTVAVLGESTAQSLTEEPAITQMRESFIDFNKRHQKVKGWRVQILVTTDRRQMENTQRDFKRNFPDYELRFSHENPFYHLKTGAFRTQDAARPFLKQMQEQYPNAFLVTDDIEMQEVLRYL